MFERSRRRILSILDDALLLTQIDVSGEQLQIRSGLFERGVEPRHGERGRVRRITPSHARAAARRIRTSCVGDQDCWSEHFSALFETAVKFSEEGGTVRLSSEFMPDSRWVIIESQGRTIPVPALRRFFDLFSIAEANHSWRGLGAGPSHGIPHSFVVRRIG